MFWSIACLPIQLLSQVLDKAAKGEDMTIDPLNSKQVDGERLQQSF